DYVPDPESCLVTGMTPQLANEQGLSEAEFASIIEREMSMPGTCVAGFNNLSFDDEFIRSLFYRNFYDPYRREYDKGNTRWDILDLVRMTHDLRPEGIEWVHDGEGKPIFKLEQLAAANRIEHDRAHDAFSDVWATVKLAELIHEKQPRLFRYFYKLRQKDHVRRILNLQKPEPLLYSAGVFTRNEGCTTIVYPLSAHPSHPNEIIAYDLRRDPSDWLDSEVDEIRRRIFTPNALLGDDERIPLHGIRMNRSPALAPISTLTPDRATALGLDVERCLQHAELLRGRPDLVRKVRAVYLSTTDSGNDPRDPELRIYTDSFFGDEDRETFRKIHETEAKELIELPPRFVDPRGPELLRRYLARNFFDLLPEQEQRRWMSTCASRLLAPELDEVLDFGHYRQKVEALLARSDTPARGKTVLRDLLDYAKWLEETVLSYR
ncbi:MAG TPA: exodeoxyribonuclease I, partial [Spirochaetia bacterium]|nr:exodeoxyribonuclease I [Spirochaetia bacterium]